MGIVLRLVEWGFLPQEGHVTLIFYQGGVFILETLRLKLENIFQYKFLKRSWSSIQRIGVKLGILDMVQADIRHAH